VKADPRPTAASQLRIGLGLTRYAMKASFRNKAGYFFSFIFPLAFVVVFGLLGHPEASLKIGVSDRLRPENPVYQAIRAIAEREHSPLLLIPGTEAELEARLSQDKIAGILAPAGDEKGSLTLVTSSGNPQSRAAAESFLRGVTNEMSLRAAGITEPAFGLESREVRGRMFRFIDFGLPGQIAFSMLSLATFGVGFSLHTLRKTLVLKRMMATNARPITLVVAQCLSRSLQAVVQTAVIIGIGVAAFGFTLAHGWLTVLEMLLLSFFGIMAFLGYGVLLSNIARDDQTLPVAMNLFNLPQVLLSGVFFPMDSMPPWLQQIGSHLPLAYLTTSLRMAAVDGARLLELWPYLAGMTAWAVVAYVLAARTFTTE